MEKRKNNKRINIYISNMRKTTKNKKLILLKGTQKINKKQFDFKWKIRQIFQTFGFYSH